MRKNKLFKKAIAVIAAACTFVSATGFNGTTVKAESFEEYQIGTEIKKTFTYEREVFLYKFSTDNTDSYYKLNLAKYGEGNGCVDIEIFLSEDLDDASKVEEFSTSDGDIGTGRDMVKKLKPNSTYYIKGATSWYGDTTSLNCKFSIEKYSTDDHADSLDDITPVAINTPITGINNHSSDVDYYSFKTDKAESFYKVNFKNVANGYLNVDWTIYEDPEMTEKVCDDSIRENQSNVYDLGNKLKADTVYYLAVTGSGDQYIQGEYTIQICQSKDDVVKTGKNAKKLELNKSYKFGIQNNADEDCFKFTTSTYIDYTITFKNTSKTQAANIEVFKDADLVYSIKDIGVSAKGSIDNNDKKLTLLPGKTYYIKVTGEEGATYTLGINAAAPANNKAKAQTVKKTRQVTISWSKVNKATGYEVYRAVKNGSYKKVATIKSAKTVKWIDKKVKKGYTYKYKVRAYAKVKGKTYYSAYSAEKAVKVK